MGAYWSATGWLLPVQWLETNIDVRPKDLLSQLRPLLPARHSPIRSETGSGNQKAYLAEIDRAVLDLVLEAAHLSIPELVGAPSETGARFAKKLDDMAELKILQDSSIEQTMREQLMQSRRGQGIFRKRVLEVEPVCRVTGIDTPNLLTASHIKPWRACTTAVERLDGFNGLMMAPHVDFLFDRGLLGFDDKGGALFSSQLKAVDGEKLGLGRIERPSPRPFHDASRTYLQHHRASVFIP